MMANSRKNVLVVAYAYEPDKTSEPGVGWHFTKQIAKFANVTVLTRSNNRKAIESKENVDGINYIYYDLPIFFTKYKKKIPYGIQIYFTIWQWKIYNKINQILKQGEGKFDLVHHLTFGMTKNVPSGYKLNVPFIWGPIGGGDFIPYRFIKTMGLKAMLSEFFYRLIHISSNLSPWAYYTRKKAKALIFRISSIIEKFPKNGCKNRFLISESAMPDTEIKRTPKSLDKALNIMCIGRIMHGKGYLYALKAFHAFLSQGGIGTLVFLGKGPEEKLLKLYVQKHKLQNHVTFKGFVPNETVKSELSKNNILLHPSFREGGSWAVMEAMSFGLPVICLNTSGTKDMVTENCGLLIDLHSPQQVVTDISKALLKLYQNKDLFAWLSSNAIDRINTEYNWQKRGKQMEEVYAKVLQKN